MKDTATFKKLALNKKTIANLATSDLRRVKAGVDVTATVTVVPLPGDPTLVLLSDSSCIDVSCTCSGGGTIMDTENHDGFTNDQICD